MHEACELFMVTFRSTSPVIMLRIKREAERAYAFYETFGLGLQIAGPDLPTRCQLISAFQKKSRGTMGRLTPPYKPGDRLTVNRKTGREGQRQRRSILHLGWMPAADLTRTCWWEVSHITRWELDTRHSPELRDAGPYLIIQILVLNKSLVFNHTHFLFLFSIDSLNYAFDCACVKFG